AEDREVSLFVLQAVEVEVSQNDPAGLFSVLVKDRESRRGDLARQRFEPPRQAASQSGLARSQGSDEINDVVRTEPGREPQPEALGLPLGRGPLFAVHSPPASRSPRRTSGNASASSPERSPASPSLASSISPARPWR